MEYETVNSRHLKKYCRTHPGPKSNQDPGNETLILVEFENTVFSMEKIWMQMVSNFDGNSFYLFKNNNTCWLII